MVLLDIRDTRFHSFAVGDDPESVRAFAEADAMHRADELARVAIENARATIEPRSPKGWWTPRQRRERGKERERIAIATGMALDGLTEDAARTAYTRWRASQGDFVDGWKPTPALAASWNALSRCESGAWGTYAGALALELETGRPARQWRSCGRRYCPACRRVQTKRIRQRVRLALDGVKSWSSSWKPLSFTLTVRDEPSRSWGAAFSLVSRALSHLTSRPTWRTHVKLALVGIEVPLSTAKTRARAALVNASRAVKVKPYSKGWKEKLAKHGIDIGEMLAVDDGRGEWWHAHAHLVVVPQACDDWSCLRCAYAGRTHGRAGLDEHNAVLQQAPRRPRDRWSMMTPAETGAARDDVERDLLAAMTRASNKRKRVLLGGEARTRAVLLVDDIDAMARIDLADMFTAQHRHDDARRIGKRIRRDSWLAQGWLLDEWRNALARVGREVVKRGDALDDLMLHDVDAETCIDIMHRRAPSFAEQMELADLGYDDPLDALSDDERERVERIEQSELYADAGVRYVSREDRAAKPLRVVDVVELRSEMLAKAGGHTVVVGLQNASALRVRSYAARAARRRRPLRLRRHVVVNDGAMRDYLSGGVRIERARGVVKRHAADTPREVLLRETMKYATKPQDVDGMPLERMADMILGSRGRRRFRGYGELFGIMLDDDDEQEEQRTTTETTFVVEGTTQTVQAVEIQWRTVLPSSTIERAFALMERTRAPP